MALLKFDNIGIQALSVTVPKNKKETLLQTDYFEADHLAKFIETTGVRERRIAAADMCASDLCLDAAQKLFQATSVPPEKIDVLLFISQTPDYRVPGSSIILQDKLNLSKSVMAFDVNLTCSGFLYGLFLSYSLLNVEGINNVLLLVGETLSKIISPWDRSTGLLLGDAGCAALIDKDSKYSQSFFSLNTDGSNYKSVIIPGGGFRKMSSPETLDYKVYEDGSKRNEEQLHMEGLDVFSFAVTEMPKDVKRILDFAGIGLDMIDKVVFHQANQFMNNFIAKKSKIDPTKILSSIQKYGNTSGVSIPLTMADQRELIKNNDLLLLNAIGAGFSWGSAILTLTDCHFLGVHEI